MKSHALYIAAGLLAVLILAGNSWIVRGGGCPDPGPCQCVVTISKSGPAAAGNTDPSCSVKVNYVPLSTSTLTNCSIVQPGSFNRIVMCDLGVRATLRCQTLTTSVGSGTAKIFSCDEDGANQPKVTASHYDGWTNNVGGKNTNASNAGPLKALWRKVFADDGQNVATIATETEVMVMTNGDGGFQVDHSQPRVTLTQGRATVTSFCDGGTAVLTAPAVINIANDSALLNIFNGLSTGTFDPNAGTCALTDLSGNWRGLYSFKNRHGDMEAASLVMSLQGSTGTITTATDTFDINRFSFSAPHLNLEAKSRTGSGTFTLSATVSKGQMELNATSDGGGPDGSDYSSGNGTAERLIVYQYALPTAALNRPYSVQLYASSPTDAPVTWSVVSGSLPAGMSLDGALGTISGTAGATGDSNFTVQVTDANGDTFQQPLTLTVNNLVLAANILPAAYRGQVYKYNLQAVGGTPPYTFTNDIPIFFPLPGFPLLSATGEVTVDLTGGGTVTGNLMFHLKDSQGLTQAMVLEIQTRGLTLTGSQILPNAQVGAPYTYTFPTSGAAGAVTWTPFKDLVNAGLQFDTTSGTLSGTPKFSGSFTFQIEARDRNGDESRNFNLTIDDATTVALAGKPCRGCVARKAGGR